MYECYLDQQFAKHIIVFNKLFNKILHLSKRCIEFYISLFNYKSSKRTMKIEV